MVQDLQRRFGGARLVKTSDEDPEKLTRPDPFKIMNEGFQQIHPMNAMNEQLKVSSSSDKSLKYICRL